MNTVEIPSDAWPRALQAFSAAHDGWLISVDVLSSAIGAHPQVRDLPLVGVVAEPHEGGGTITITAALSGAGQITRTIHGPTRVWVEKTDQGADAAMQIESADGTATIVRFRTSALPETVDGLVQP
jgi:hypothetical protein